MKKIALITGIGGQASSYLAEFLLEKDYRVVGLMRRNATNNLENASHLENIIEIEEGDVTDMSCMLRLIQRCRPQEIYFCSAMSHVHTSFEQPLTTFDINTKGLVNILESVKTLGYSSRLFHCSTSEQFGDAKAPQNTETIFKPKSPYAISKIASHHFVELYREAYKMYCVNGIMFNYESPRRGPKFVTRKITIGVARCLQDINYKLKLGNIHARRDWGYCPDYVEGFWLALQQETPKDYIFATGETHSVEEFLEEAFTYVGLDWKNYVEIERFLYRPLEVPELCGDASKTKEMLGWEPKIKFKELVRIMVDADCRQIGLIRHNETAENLANRPIPSIELLKTKNA